MASITIQELAALHIDFSDEHGAEHAVLIILRDGLVKPRSNIFRRESLLGHHTEQIDYHRHKERGWYSLTAHVANTEIESVVLNEEVVKVASHLLGRLQYAVDVDMVVLGEKAWHHPHLYFPCDAELTLHALLGRRRLLQLVVGLSTGVHSDSFARECKRGSG